jgi:hypothetical protein
MKHSIIAEMINTQTALNNFQDPNWLSKGWNYRLAIMVEAMEGLESHGWKWWKKQETDVNNCRMELVDIWHFMLSDIIRTMHLKIKGTSEEKLAASLAFTAEALSLTYTNAVRLSITNEALWVAVAKDYSYKAFNALRDCYVLDDIKLSNLYFGKAALNKLRASNGYKTGSYVKIWQYNGKMVEDNLVAAELAANYDLSDVAALELFRTKLADYYKTQR